jgi:polyferredoxin
MALIIWPFCRILILLIYEHGLSFHFLMSSSVFQGLIIFIVVLSHVRLSLFLGILLGEESYCDWNCVPGFFLIKFVIGI